MNRRATTLMELMVVAALGIVALVLIFNAVSLMLRGERATDRESTKALTDSRLMQALLQDVRSTTRAIEGKAGGPFTIHRNVLERDRLVERDVRWSVVSPTTIERRADGEPTAVFSYAGLLEPGTPALKLRIERITDPGVRFP